jgi:hypothetical protein
MSQATAVVESGREQARSRTPILFQTLLCTEHGSHTGRSSATLLVSRS